LVLALYFSKVGSDSLPKVPATLIRSTTSFQKL
jgi:hypothetical protein